MLSTACEQFLGKTEEEIHNIALVTLEGHQRAIMGSMTVEVIIRYIKFKYYYILNIYKFKYYYIIKNKY